MATQLGSLYTVTRLEREYFIVFDPIAARAASLPHTVLGGYTTRRAAEDAAELLLGN